METSKLHCYGQRKNCSPIMPGRNEFLQQKKVLEKRNMFNFFDRINLEIEINYFVAFKTHLFRFYTWLAF